MMFSILEWVMNGKELKSMEMQSILPTSYMLIMFREQTQHPLNRLIQPQPQEHS